jgi:hypothetical protein
VGLFVAETEPALKVDKPATATLTAGTNSSQAAGKTVPNELNASTSFDGTIPAADTLFDTLAKAPILKVVVSAAGQSASPQNLSLKSLGNRADEFIGVCRKA